MPADTPPAPHLPSPAALPGGLAGNALCMASMLIWAAGFPLVDLLLPHVPPLPLTALRMLLAFAVILALWVAREGLAPLVRAPWRRGMVIGGAGFGLGAFLLVYAQSRTDAVTVAVVSATMPVLAVTIECLLDRRPLTLALAGGLVLSLAGGFLAYAAGLGEIRFGPGAWAALASILAFSLASRATVRGLSHISALGRSAVTFAGAAAATSAGAIAVSAAGDGFGWIAMDGRTLAALLAYGCVSLAISQLLWLMSIERLGIGIASMHINAAPFYVMVFAMLLGAAFNPWQAAGAAVVILGVVVAQRPPQSGAARRRPV